MKRLALLLVLVCVACDPTIKKFEVTPDSVPCGTQVKLEWEGTGDGLHLDADKAVSPALPATLPKSGTRNEAVFHNTTFSLYYPGAGHREKSVTVTGTCPGGGTGTGSCGPQVLEFTGQCLSAASGPNYVTRTLDATAAPGNLVDLLSDADFPVHVQHAGQDIALGAHGGPLFPPVPVVPAAGDYTITIPGQVGQMACAGAGPTSGTTDAPVIHLTVTPTCPKK